MPKAAITIGRTAGITVIDQRERLKARAFNPQHPLA
jgi:hypothetical protein